MAQADLIRLLNKAVATEFGLCVRTANVDLLRTRLYAARRAALQPELDDLSIQRSPSHPNEIWLQKKRQAANAGT